MSLAGFDPDATRLGEAPGGDGMCDGIGKFLDRVGNCELSGWATIKDLFLLASVSGWDGFVRVFDCLTLNCFQEIDSVEV